MIKDVMRRKMLAIKIVYSTSTYKMSKERSTNPNRLSITRRLN